jgi:hypothetical protein
MSHMSVLGACCWVQAYFEKEVYFGCRPIFGERSILGKTYFWKGRPNFGVRATVERKQACRKRRKSKHAREKQMWCAGRQA